MHATIIGIDGGMGQWMKTHLMGLGYTVTGFDERKGDNPVVLGEADLVVVSVPIPVTAETIRKTANHMKQGACLMELSSLKSGIHEAMIEAAGLGSDVLCIHPMWGPATDGLDGKTVVLIPVIDVKHELDEISRLFPGALFEVVEADEHDRLMSIILALPYLINLALAVTIKDEDLTKLRKLSGTTFALQYTLVQSILGEKLSLIKALCTNNVSIEEESQNFLENYAAIINKIGTQSFNDLFKETRNKLQTDPFSFIANDIRQDAFNTFQQLGKN